MPAEIFPPSPLALHKQTQEGSCHTDTPPKKNHMSSTYFRNMKANIMLSSLNRHLLKHFPTISAVFICGVYYMPLSMKTKLEW